MGKKQKHSGYINDLSAEQEAVMHQIIDWIRQSGTVDMDTLLWDENDILRFCRARKFDIAKIRTMIENFAQWRRDENIDTLYDTWTFPEKDAMKVLYPHGVHKFDRNGHPIQIERPGVAQLEALFRRFPREQLIRYLTFTSEAYKVHFYPACARYSGHHVEQTCQIFDLTEGNVRKMMSRNCINLLKMGAQLAQDYYPETMGSCYIVNAPMLFTALYAIVKGFLDERTRSKIRILGSSYQSVLLENIDAENLPDFLGGRCTCSHVRGGCLYSEAGPWNDYAVVNKRIIHKDELAAQEASKQQDEEEEKKGPPMLEIQPQEEKKQVQEELKVEMGPLRIEEEAKGDELGPAELQLIDTGGAAAAQTFSYPQTLSVGRGYGQPLRSPRRDSVENTSCDISLFNNEVIYQSTVNGKKVPLVGLLPESRATFFGMTSWKYKDQARDR